jgi:predicted DNA binding protein/PAS domain-containing protein
MGTVQRDETDGWWLTRGDYERLLGATDTHRKSLIVRLIAEAGLRTAEVTRVRPRDVRSPAGRPGASVLNVSASDGEDGSERLTYLGRNLGRAFERYVWSNDIGDDARVIDVSPRRVQMLLSDVADRAAEETGDPRFAGVSAGDLRAFFARTLLVEERVDPRVVRAVGGWESLESLDRILDVPDESTVIDELSEAAVRARSRRAPDGTDRTMPRRGTRPNGPDESGLVRSVFDRSDAHALVTLDPDGYVERWVGGTARTSTANSEDPVGRHLSSFYPEAAIAGDRPREHLATAAETGRYEAEGWRVGPDGREFWARTVLVARGPRTETRGFTMVLWDLTERKRREQQLRERVDALERRRNLHERVRAVDDAVRTASDRGDLESSVCDHLVAGPEHAVAWVATTDLDGDRPTPATWAGTGRETVDVLFDRLEQNDRPTPWADVLRDGGVDVRTVDEDPTDEGIEAVVAVPISHRETTYGALVVAAPRDSVPDWERSTLAALGRRVGHAVTAIQRRNLLLSDAVVELEFWCDDDDALFVDLSERFDCAFAVESIVPVSGSSLLFYVTMSGAAPGDVFDSAVDHRGVEEVRLVENHDDGCLLEFVVGGDSPLLTLTAYGGTVTEAVVESGEAQLLAEVARDADIRTVVDGLTTAFPRTELVGKHEVERPVRTVREFREGVADQLTDRQEASIRAAYYAGYFDWPRGSTAEEVADSMGVSSPTLHNHLRKAQRALLETFFER